MGLGEASLRERRARPADTHIRQACRTDIDAIMGLSRQFVATGQLRARTKDSIADATDDFLVAVEDGQIVGCIGLRPCGDGAWVLYNFAVSPSRHGRGLGSRLVSSAIAAASCDGPSVIYTATTRTDGWFTRHGFVATTKDRVAADWAATLDPSRPSRLFVRSLSPSSAEVTHPSPAPPESAMRSGAG